MYLIFDGSVLPRRRFPKGDIGSAMYVATTRPIPKNVVAVHLSACLYMLLLKIFLNLLGGEMFFDVFSGHGRRRRRGVLRGAATP